MRKRKPRSTKKYMHVRHEARARIHARILYYNRLYQVPIGRIFIRNQKTRWGSASSKGNLNFNWRVVHLPEHLLDYLVVHELCHLREFNHSSKFWDLVAKAVPEYKHIRKELRAVPL